MAQTSFESDVNMAEDVFEPQTEQNSFDTWDPDTVPEQKNSGCLKGCLIIGAVMLIVFIVGIWVASQHWRGWASGFARTTLNEMLRQSELPAAEQEQIRSEVERLFTEFEEGRLTQAQVQRLIDELAGSPLSANVIARAIEEQYFDSSSLSDEEKETGRMTLRRCARGVFDRKLSEEDVDAVLGKIGTKNPDGRWELKETLTDEELRTFLAEARSRADEAGIPETVEEIDLAVEVKRIIDAVLSPEAPETEEPMPDPSLPAEAPQQARGL